MKTEAYICDNCGQLRPAEECAGIKPIEDMFERLNSFPIIADPAKAEIHQCTTCYNQKVIYVADREHDRKKDEQGYISKLNEMGYLLRSKCVENFKRKSAKKLQK